MKELLNEYSEKAFNGKSDDTIKTYLKEVELFNQWLVPTGTDLTGFSRIDVQHYINWLTAKNYAPSTINKKFRAISHYCRFIGHDEYIKDIRIVKPISVQQLAPNSLKKNERNQLIREVSRTGKKRDFAVIIFLLNTGLRVKECSNLKLVNLIDVSEKKGFLKVYGKGSVERLVPINSEIRHALNEYLLTRNIDIYNLDQLNKEVLNSPLFLSNYNKALSVRQIQRIVSTYGDKIHPHVLRHTFATVLIREKGIDVSTVAQLLGHANLNTIQRYTKADEEELLEAVETLTQG